MAKKKQKYPQDSNQEKNQIYIKADIQPKNEAQAAYIDALDAGTVILSNGPAGTGKTYIAAFKAMEALLSNRVKKIVLTRPIRETGEKLGFLPGEMEDKIHPYLLPLLDAFEDFVGPAKLKVLMENGQIEVAPLAYMRGRTFSNAYCILDEAQNATHEQLKMFLTRIGSGTTIVINGDASQCDIPGTRETSIEWAQRKLSGSSNKIYICEFQNRDIVRLELISTMLKHLDSPDPK